MIVATGFDITLKGRLPVELDSKVDNVSTLQKTERRCIGPATGNVDTDWRARPDNLVEGALPLS